MVRIIQGNRNGRILLHRGTDFKKSVIVAIGIAEIRRVLYRTLLEMLEGWLRFKATNKLPQRQR